MRLTWAQPEDLLAHELVAAAADGKDIDDVRARWVEAGGDPVPAVSGAGPVPATPELRELARRLLAELDALPALPDPGQPEAWDDIVAVLPEPRVVEPGPDFAARVLGAWTGRAARCLLGKPVEKISRVRGSRRSRRRPDAGRSTGGSPRSIPDDVARRWPWNKRSRRPSSRRTSTGCPRTTTSTTRSSRSPSSSGTAVTSPPTTSPSRGSTTFPQGGSSPPSGSRCATSSGPARPRDGDAPESVPRVDRCADPHQRVRVDQPGRPAHRRRARLARRPAQPHPQRRLRRHVGRGTRVGRDGGRATSTRSSTSPRVSCPRRAASQTPSRSDAPPQPSPISASQASGQRSTSSMPSTRTSTGSTSSTTPRSSPTRSPPGAETSAPASRSPSPQAGTPTGRPPPSGRSSAHCAASTAWARSGSNRCAASSPPPLPGGDQSIQSLADRTVALARHS